MRGGGGGDAEPSLPAAKKERFTDFLGSSVIIHQMPDDKVGKRHLCFTGWDVKRVVYPSLTFYIIYMLKLFFANVNNESDSECLLMFI